jgi:hypothetical protein
LLDTDELSDRFTASDFDFAAGPLVRRKLLAMPTRLPLGARASKDQHRTLRNARVLGYRAPFPPDCKL